MGFTKLDEGILQSSIMAESSDIFKIWVALMAACQENGIAPLSPVYLSSICRLPIEIVVTALDRLRQPDPNSRSTEDDGRRIKRVDGGFYLINYKKYRDYTYSKSKEAERKRMYRKRKRMGQLGHVPNVPDISASVLNKNLNKINKNLKEKIKEIVDYLNEKAGKKFRPNSESTVEFIKARLEEERTVEDFKKVIDIKVSKWKGRTWADKRTGETCQGNDFLRPSTLFRRCHFEEYLNEELATEAPAPSSWHKEAEERIRKKKEEGEIL